MWSNFECISFEERPANSAYFINSLFKISCDAKVESQPNVNAQIQNNLMVLAIDKTLALLENESQTDCNFSSFSSNIDCNIISETGDVIICCLSDGNIHGIYIKGIPIFNLTIESEDIGENKTFAGIQFYNSSYYILCVTGALYKISNIDEQKIKELVAEISYSRNLDETIWNATLERIEKKKYINNLNIFSLITDVKFNDTINVNYITANKSTILIGHENSFEKIKLNDFMGTITKVINIKSRIICLGSNGRLFEICPYTNMISVIFSSKDIFIHDLVVLDSDANDETELLISVRSTVVIDDSYCMKIIQFPELKSSFEIPHKGKMWLVSQPKGSLNMYYITGVTSDSEIVQNIEIKVITEVQPLQRYEKLIKIGNLDQAEAFAIEFKLSLQPLLKEKARKVLQNIGMSKIDEKLENKFENLMILLNQIDDKKYLLSLQNAEIPERNMLGSLLEFLLKNINHEEYKNDVDDINERVIRLETLRIIDPYECDMDWKKFVFHSNMIQLCKDLLKSDICNASVVWSRHSSQVVPNIDKNTVRTILNAIPASTQPFHLILWLRLYVPSLLYSKPIFMSDLVDWSLEQTRNLEISELWPQIGFEFINNVHGIFNDFNKKDSEIFHQYESNMEKITILQEALCDLTNLTELYNLNISIEEYITNTAEESAFILIKKVRLDYLQKFVDNFLYPKFIAKGDSPLNVLVKYIEYLTRNSKHLPSWQSRAVVVIELIPNEEKKLQCVLLVVESAPVPFSDYIKPLIKYGASNHPIARAILVQYERESLKLIKVKYGWSPDATESHTLLIFRMVKLNLPELIEDMKVVVNMVPDIMFEANYYCSYELARHGNVEKAINYIDSIDSKDHNDFCQYLINSISDDLDENSIKPDEIEYLLEFMKLLSYRITETSYGLNKLDEIQKILNLRKLFNLQDATISSIKLEENKIAFLKLGLENVMEAIKDNQINYFEYIWKKLMSMSHLLAIDPVIAFYEAAKHLDNIYVSCNLAYIILTACDLDKNNVKFIFEFAIFLLARQISFMDNGDQTNATDPLTFPILHRLLEAALRIKENFINYVGIKELLQWTRIGSSLYPIDIVEININELQQAGNDTFKYMINLVHPKPKKQRESISLFEHVNNIKDKTILNFDPETVLNCVGKSIKVVTYILNSTDEPYTNLQQFWNSNPLSEQDISDDFFIYVEQLMKMKQHSSVFLILQQILKYSRNSPKNILPNTFLNIIYKRMIKYALSLKELDNFDLLRPLIIVFADGDPTLLISTLSNEMKTDMQKLNFWKLSELYHELKGNENDANTSKQNRIKHYYYTELCNQSPALTYDISLHFVSVSSFMSNLRNEIVSVSLLKNLSIDLNWSYDEILVMQVIKILNSQQIQFDVKTDIFGKEQIKVKTSPTDIFNLVQPYIFEIENKEVLVTSLLGYLKKINSYFYELYVCVIQIFTSINKLPVAMKLWSQILLFLQHEMVTKRQNPPGQLETDLWLKSKSEIGILPKISKYRFPFLQLVEEPLKTILDEEVSVGNCVKWFPLIKLHAMLHNKTSDKEIEQLQEYFCMSAVKKSFGDYKSLCTEIDSDVWNLKPINNVFLESILQLVKHMKCSTKIIFILYFITNHTPNGADQVEAAYECYKFAIENEEELMQNEKSRETVIKIKRKYPFFKIQHLLHLHNLAEEKLFQLLENPKELIVALYNHDVILQQNKPDINKIVEEIAEYYHIDLKSIQQTLLHKWLAFSYESNEANLDETFYDDLNSSSIENSEINDEFVNRAYFILKSWETKQAIQFLVANIYNNRHNTNIRKQLHLLECLFKLKNEDSAEYFNVIEPQEYIIVKCVYLLKQIGINYTIKKFEEIDKLKCLKQIWVQHANNPKALIIMNHICIGFNVCIPKLWNGVLKQMVALNMINELSSLINVLSTKTQLLHIDGLPIAWNYVVKSSFRDAKKHCSEDSNLFFGKTFVLLQSCPVVSQLRLIDIAEDFIRMNKPNMASILISFANKNDKETIVQMVLANKSENLKQNIIDLEELGIIPIITKFVIHELRL